MRARSLALLGLPLLGVLASCGAEVGIVEVYWQVEDAALRRLYPPGDRSSTCAFTDLDGANFDLRVRLTIVHASDACAASPADAACQVVAPVVFDCLRARGTVTDIPPSSQDASEGNDDPGYLMFVEPLIVPEVGEPFVARSTCVGRPGPRKRRVRAGRITDLEVHELVFHALTSADAKVDLEACRPDADTDGGTDTGSETAGSETGTGTT